MPAKKLATAAVIALLLVVLAALAAALAQVTIMPGTTRAPAADEAAPQINAVTVVGEMGATRYVAAGTSQGLRVYELRRVGNQYQVKDVTLEAR